MEIGVFLYIQSMACKTPFHVDLKTLTSDFTLVKIPDGDNNYFLNFSF